MRSNVTCALRDAAAAKTTSTVRSMIIINITPMPEQTLVQICLTPIGFVRSSVSEAVDDVWGGLRSRIDLDASRFTPDCLAGLDRFSHVDIIFVFDRVGEDAIEYGARQPRGRTDWPRVGIFAQRAKNRPNRLGVTVCRLLSVRY